ncbi:hypothetical protein [Cysteiniphilum sp. JM-1]|uniref:hypothetical protein n=1 Tax=Cysteiniphilum sp. JM-1 TaxID=2610891 RepID=UPI001248DBBC|nr:hypothetical protein [Cysteiniphilum sp. JM-1]
MHKELSLSNYLPEYLCISDDKKIHEGSCCYCHLQATKEIALQILRNEQNLAEENNLLICEFCLKVMNLSQYSINYDGQDIVLPMDKLSQAEINHIFAALPFMTLEQRQLFEMYIKQLIDEVKTSQELLADEASNPGVLSYLLATNTLAIKDISQLKLLPLDYLNFDREGKTQ